MTLLEMAEEYRANAAVLRERRNLLREELKKSDDPVTRQALERRIRDLNQLYREGREVALVMERYYERGP